MSDRLNYSAQQKARCIPTILSAGPTLAVPRLIQFCPLSSSVSRMADDCLTHFDHLILDSLTLHLAFYFSCTTTPQATLLTMCSGMIMRQKVSTNSILRICAQGLDAQSQTSRNMWCPRIDLFLYIHVQFVCKCIIIYLIMSTVLLLLYFCFPDS